MSRANNYRKTGTTSYTSKRGYSYENNGRRSKRSGVKYKTSKKDGKKYLSAWYVSRFRGLIGINIALHAVTLKTSKEGTKYYQTYAHITDVSTGATGIQTAFCREHGENWTIPNADIYVNVQKNAVQSIRAIQRYKQGKR